MRYEQIRQAPLFLKLLKHINYLCLNGYIQRRYGLIAHDKLGIYRQRSGNTDTLSLAAGKLVRVAAYMVRLQSDHFQQRLDAFYLFFRGTNFMYLHRLADQVAYSKTRIERSVRILKYDLHSLFIWGKLFIRQVGDVIPIEEDLSIRRFIQSKRCSPQRSFAAA